MTPPSYDPGRLLGNIAALIGILLAGAYLLDRLLRWMGFASDALCATAAFLAPLALAAGLVFFAIGMFIAIVSRARGGDGIALVVAGVLLSLLPEMMPGYFGGHCLVTS